MPAYAWDGALTVRVAEHPVLGPLPEVALITIYFEGRPVEARAGEPVAAALLAAGIKALRITRRRHEPRGVFCALGRCTDCVMVVDGIPNTRTCVTPVRQGMQVRRQGVGE